MNLLKNQNELRLIKKDNLAGIDGFSLFTNNVPVEEACTTAKENVSDSILSRETQIVPKQCSIKKFMFSRRQNSMNKQNKPSENNL